MIKISIILPCYNVAAYIDRCLESIYRQDFNNYEIICINDGSTDNTLDIINKWGGGFTNIKIKTFPNQGLSQARNEGLKLASGEYIYFFDPDDYINPGTLKAIYGKAKEGDYDAVHFGFKTIYEDQDGIHYNKSEKPYVYQSNNEIIHEYLPQFLGITQKNIDEWVDMTTMWNSKQFSGVWRFLYKRSILVEHNITFPKGIKLIEDKIFNARFFCYANTIATMEEVFYNYIIKEKGLLTSSINNAKGLVNDKIIGIEQRALLRETYLKEHGLDIFSFYIGTIVFSALELIMRMSSFPFNSTRKEFSRYINLPDVKIGIKNVHISNLPLKLKLAIGLLKIKMHYPLLLGMRILYKLSINIKI